MTELFKKGDYSVVAEKRDKYLPEWAGNTFVLSVFVTLIVGIIVEGYIATRNNFDEPIKGITMFVILFFIAFMGSLVAFLPLKYAKCGIEIYLCKKEKELDDPFIIEKTGFQLGDDPIIDGKKISDIVYDYSKIIELRIKEESVKVQTDNESKKACCTKYESVIQVVKQNEFK